MQKAERDLRRRVADCGLILVSMEFGGGGNVHVTAQAPNGVKKRFSVSKDAKHPNTVKTQESWFRGFARENAAPMQTAIQQAAAKVTAPNAMVVAMQQAASTPSPTASTQQSLLEAAPATTTESQPMTTTEKPKQEARNFLNIKETVQLTNWLTDTYKIDEAKPQNYSAILNEATKAFGFKITIANISGIMEQMGMKLHRPEKVVKPAKVASPTANERMLAHHLRELMRQVNFKVPPEVAELAGPEQSDEIF